MNVIGGLEFIVCEGECFIVRFPVVKPDFLVCYTLGIDVIDMSASMGIVVTHRGMPLATDENFQLRCEGYNPAPTIASYSGANPCIAIEIVLPGLLRHDADLPFSAKTQTP